MLDAGSVRSRFLRAIDKRPTAKPVEIAKEIGVATSQVHALARRPQDKGVVAKRGLRYTRTDKAG